MRQAVAYNKAIQQQDGNPKGNHLEPPKPPVIKGSNDVPQLQKAMSILQTHGMHEAAEALRQAAAIKPKSGPSAAPPVPDAEKLLNTLNGLEQGNGAHTDDPYWNRPPGTRCSFSLLPTRKW